MTKKSLNEKEVEQFLLLNPDFLSKNSHILNALEIVHETGGAVSLIQKQVELLRENYNSTSNNLLGLIEIAKNNENIFLRAQGRAAMMGFLVICGTYAFTGHIIPGIY